MVLAAGMGTRMRSGLHKILHPVAGDPIISHVLSAIAAASISDVVMVVGHRSDQVMSAVGNDVRYALQQPQLGTGHALQQAVSAMDSVPDRVLVLCGDTPLLKSATLSRMVSMQRDAAAVVLLSAVVENPTGYGRIVRGEDGSVLAIVEEADADEETRRIEEINSGLYCFDGRWLVANLPKLKKSAKGEYYLTDLVAEAVCQGRRVLATVADDETEVMGVNDRSQLADADRVMRDRICKELMASGVTIIDPANTYIGKDVKIGVDSVILPGTHLRGNTVVGERCEIGPNSIVDDSSIGNDCRVIASMLEQSRVADHVSIGPFSHLRPGAVIASNARLGNYAEVKNSSIGEGVQMHHFSYIGDAEIGEGTNIGAGTITCNFNNKGEKHRTKVGKHVFLGSDTMLRAPIEIGDGAATGAGSVVTRNVPPGVTVFGVPARQKEGSEKQDSQGRQ
ncbi:MAG TPA: bifunctional UDP-N-acetylglucosamine diphosphorylase/glucosamine-1-phosphate N-acetyltransferase GlmU [Chloroflexota bacterium]|nr:bifunctional UDP-N-acetylglucosamine diphosphorylase/glucosamine-1-phosphate N-acetyltransferase GlmU [Chloroflexota bacterium]